MNLSLSLLIFFFMPLNNGRPRGASAIIEDDLDTCCGSRKVHTNVNKLFISPHNDDECLFGSWTLLRENPTVLIVYDSFTQPSRDNACCDANTRRLETLSAMNVLGIKDVQFLGISDLETNKEQIREALGDFAAADIAHVWAPAVETNGHEQHNAVGQIVLEMFGVVPLTRYMTYTRSNGKSRGREVPIERGEWIINKLRAMACYHSQIEIPRLGCWPHFVNDLREYYV